MLDQNKTEKVNSKCSICGKNFTVNKIDIRDGKYFECPNCGQNTKISECGNCGIIYSIAIQSKKPGKYHIKCKKCGEKVPVEIFPYLERQKLTAPALQETENLTETTSSTNINSEEDGLSLSIDDKKLEEDISKKEATEENISTSNNNKMNNVKNHDIHITIGFKLISIISLILTISLVGMTFLATNLFKSDNEVRVKEITLDRAELTAQKVKSDFNSILEKSKLLMSSIQTDEPVKIVVKKTDKPAATAEPVKSSESIAESFFQNENDIIFIGLVEKESDAKLKITKFIKNNDFLNKNSLEGVDFDSVINKEAESFTKNFNSEFTVHNASVYFNIPVIVVRSPYKFMNETTATSILVVYLSMNRFQDAVKSQSIYKSFIVNGDGDVIAHYDSNLVKTKANFLKLPIVTMMMKSPVDNGQTRYKDDKGEYYLGSFMKTGFSDIGVVTVAQESIAFAAVYKVQKRNIIITVIILNLAILVIFIFSKTLTRPIIKLVEASKLIKEGKFILNLKPTSKDEIGELTKSFVEMGRGLAEREKLKETFGKFVNKEIAEQVLKGTIKLGGERKNATVFFSDIRGFTEISEKLEPEEVVEFLNEYMTRMVRCVNKTNGVVDKFIGDAIMAVWGAPITRDNDTENALNGALMMRKELMQFNKGRGGPKKPIIKIGCGINCGPLLAGQIGSEEKMEYTVIGDTVNLASRIEQLNKPFGTDILISEEIYDIIKDKFIMEPMQPIKVKGKAEPQQIYAVLGRMDDPTSPKTLQELRDILGINITGKPDAPEEEEVKYKILDTNSGKDQTKK